ncbi:type I restriction enzyme HsdR N-terminal domain-containing protein [Autumnicola edwardsiae]|uniref:Type I restriction enzyme HsdR N-terminal domain-containing protein n=1 Tax=Autumnicola edwardsiae TaxID=3075594 RepID=A0ABU3CRT4_9FLAO|nr:type I restriction enzyme HsdR N-terminal domain-containing protein [Zunongwangia sp. F297]MDT0649069.1 type I restriction enzyme HsdR N-terminal domain-containing protein [Zunongwangia sp. F297]
MQELNFPRYSFRFKNNQNKTAVFDKLRKKFVILTPEEWVRQNCVRFLTEEKNYPESLINVEKQLKLGDLVKRYDIVVFNRNGNIHLIVECKAPKIRINQDTFDQIARYNLNLDATYLMVTNGINHYYCQMDYKAEKYNFLKELPPFQQNEQ